MEFRYTSPDEKILVATLIAAGWDKARIVQLSPDELAGQVALLSQDSGTIATWAQSGFTPSTQAPTATGAATTPQEAEIEALREAYPCPTTSFIAEIEAQHQRNGTQARVGKAHSEVAQ